jgi:fructose-1,6-bisphosphatase/inositol monophosphatase family enzyme
MHEFTNYQPEVAMAREAGRMAGAIILKYFESGQNVQYKGDGSPVTVADKLINDNVIELAAEHFPADGVIGEEASTAETNQERLWYCDPIDGTIAYTWGTPTSMFSLALQEGGQTKVGYVYDAFLEREYIAVAGEGSYCNDQKLQVSDLDLEDRSTVVAVSSSVDRILAEPHIKTLRNKGVKLAIFSGAVCKAALVARGNFAGYIEAGVGRHDVAAAELIITEAGGRVTDLAGRPLNYSQPFLGAIMSNGVVHDELVAIVKPEL